jgi:hypothetical protein
VYIGVGARVGEEVCDSFMCASDHFAGICGTESDSWPGEFVPYFEAAYALLELLSKGIVNHRAINGHHFVRFIVLFCDLCLDSIPPN